MKTRISKTGLVSILLSVLLIVFIYRHPILLKWMTGSARVVGAPVRCSVYADGKIDKKIRVFHSDKYWDEKEADYYILYILSPYPYKTKHIIKLDIGYKFAGVPVSTNKSDFDLVFGILFQSETGAYFSDFRDDRKGYNFDPHLDISGKIIRFMIPSRQKPDGSLIRIELSE